MVRHLNTDALKKENGDITLDIEPRQILSQHKGLVLTMI